MGTVERRAREREAVRGRILEAAREVFVREGFEAVTMRKIADRIEYTPAALYRHFPDKEALLAALVQADFSTFAAQFREVAGVADPVERIRQAGRAYIEFAVAFPSHYRLLFMTPRPAVRPREEGAEDPGREAYLFLRRAVEEAVASGRLRPGLEDVGLVTHTLWAAVHGVASLHVAFHDEPWIEGAPQTSGPLVIDGLLRGLVRQPDGTSGGRDRGRKR
jgi:AcrR family transcriptional regulator